MSIALLLGLTLATAAPQQQRPEDLMYIEIYACSLIAKAEHAKMFEGRTSPVTDSERARAEAFALMDFRAAAALPAAQAREHIEERNIRYEQGAAREVLASLDADQTAGALTMCAAVFEVELPR